MEIANEQISNLYEHDKKISILINSIPGKSMEEIHVIQEQLSELETNRSKFFEELLDKAKLGELASCGGKRLSAPCPDKCPIAGTSDLCTGDFFHYTSDATEGWE